MSEVKEEIELAREALRDLERMTEVSLRRRYTTLYFAAYHAARAALLAQEYAPKTHAGLDSLVHNILAKEGSLSTDAASLFSKLKSRREQADYGTGFYGTEEEFEELREEGGLLVEELIALAADS